MKLGKPGHLRPAVLPILALFCFFEISFPLSAVGDAPSFRRDIQPLLTKQGCNAGACHGNLHGKGGLKLSLRGEFPPSDIKALLDQGRVNPKDPGRSPVIRKPAGLSPHEGGIRFEKDSEEYRLLLAWISDGAKDDPKTPPIDRLEVSPPKTVLEAPDDSVKLTATAYFADGEKRDVTRWALFEPSDLHVEVSRDGVAEFDRPGEAVVTVSYLGKKTPVRVAMIPESHGYEWQAPAEQNSVDLHVFAKLKTLKINPSPICDDSTFVRRVYFDVIGRPPTGDEARSFVEDRAPDKRTKLIDSLLQQPEFADFWAMKWADLLRVEEKLLDSKGVASFHGWIRDAIGEGMPIDRFAREILSATGSTYKNPPANYYRALRKPNVRAEAVAQVFLGTRIACAQCHDHPFDRWSQDDYYRFAALFDGVGYKILENKRRDKNDKNMFIGEQLVTLTAAAEVKHPRTGKFPQAGFLDPSAPEFEDCVDRLDQFAGWATSAEHPLFARVQANRIWYHMLGKGVVDPPDDFRSTNPPSNPALLDHLEEEFVRGKFDLRHLIRHIANSATYQLSSEPNDTNSWDVANFSRAEIRRYGAEQLVDAVHQFLGMPGKFNGLDGVDRAVRVPGINAVYRDGSPSFCDSFIKLFGRPDRITNSDLERTNETSLAQIFTLTSSRGLNELLISERNLLKGLPENPGKQVELLTWAALSRAPTDEELRGLVDYLQNSDDRRKAQQDIAWALINSKEFLLRH